MKTIQLLFLNICRSFFGHRFLAVIKKKRSLRREQGFAEQIRLKRDLCREKEQENEGPEELSCVTAYDLRNRNSIKFREKEIEKLEIEGRELHEIIIWIRRKRKIGYFF